MGSWWCLDWVPRDGGGQQRDPDNEQSNNRIGVTRVVATCERFSYLLSSCKVLFQAVKFYWVRSNGEMCVVLILD